MNKVYTMLIDDVTVTTENIEKKIKESTTFEFNDIQMELLKKNLIDVE